MAKTAASSSNGLQHLKPIGVISRLSKNERRASIEKRISK